MPSLGMNQTPAGVEKKPLKKPYSGVKTMESKDSTIRPSLKINTDCQYKGNAVLNAQR